MKENEVCPLDLMALNEESQVTFLREDIELCHTFAALSKSRFDTGLQESARQAQLKAENGYVAVARLVKQLHDPLYQNEINQRLDRLRAVLDQVAEIWSPVGGSSREGH